MRATLSRTPRKHGQEATTRIVVCAAITLGTTAFLGSRFLEAARTTLGETRRNACRALAPDPIPPQALGPIALDFQLPDASGQLVSLAMERGHPVVLNFWATWCPPCVEEIPALETLARQIDGTDLRMLAVSVDDDWTPVRGFFARGTPIGVLLDTSHEVPKRYGTLKYPETFFIDTEGRVRYYFINTRDWGRPETLACLESLR